MDVVQNLDYDKKSLHPSMVCSTVGKLKISEISAMLKQKITSSPPIFKEVPPMSVCLCSNEKNEKTLLIQDPKVARFPKHQDQDLSFGPWNFGRRNNATGRCLRDANCHQNVGRTETHPLNN